jgi:hypothetical protein
MLSGNYVSAILSTQTRVIVDEKARDLYEMVSSEIIQSKHKGGEDLCLRLCSHFNRLDLQNAFAIPAENILAKESTVDHHHSEAACLHRESSLR